MRYVKANTMRCSVQQELQRSYISENFLAEQHGPLCTYLRCLSSYNLIRGFMENVRLVKGLPGHVECI